MASYKRDKYDAALPAVSSREIQYNNGCQLKSYWYQKSFYSLSSQNQPESLE